MRWLVVAGLLCGACRTVSPPVEPLAAHARDEPAEPSPAPAPAPSRLQGVLAAAQTEWETEPSTPTFEHLYRRGLPDGVHWRETGRLDPIRAELDRLPRSDPSFPDQLRILGMRALYQAEFARDRARSAESEPEREQARIVADHYAHHAVDAFLELVGDDAFRGFSQRDNVLFGLSQAAVVLGDDALEIRAYERLLAEHPQSRFERLCHIGLGNVAYRQGRFDDALGAFDHVLAGKPSEESGYTEYRRAWTQLHRGDLPAAEAGFLRALESADRGFGPRESFVISLRSSARLGLLHTMLDADVADAFARIEHLGEGPRKREDARRRMQEHLALGLLTTGRFAKALQAYDLMLEPDTARRCRLALPWIASALALGDAEAATERLRRLESTAPQHEERCAPVLEHARALIDDA